jgi:hypothetical protein
VRSTLRWRTAGICPILVAVVLAGCRQLSPYETRPGSTELGTTAPDGRGADADGRATGTEAGAGKEVGPLPDGKGSKDDSGSGAPTFLFAAQVGSAQADTVGGVAMTSGGNRCFAGSHYPTSAVFLPGGKSVKTFTATSSNGMELYVVCFDSAGALAWASSFGGTGTDSATVLVADASGYLYVGGRFEGSVTFGSTTLINKTTTSGVGDGFVVKLDGSSGDVKKAYAITGTDDKNVAGLVVDAAGNIYASGTFKQSITFQSATDLASKGGTDAFVVKIDTSENQTGWSLGGSGEETVAGLATDGTSLFLAGAFASQDIVIDPSGSTSAAQILDGYVVSLTSSFSTNWAAILGGAQKDRLLSVGAGGNMVCVSGDFKSAPGTFAGVSLTATTGTPGYVACYDTSGTARGAVAFGCGTGSSCALHPNALSLDSSGGLILAGDLVGSTNFGGGSFSSASNSIAEGFLAIFGPVPKVFTSLAYRAALPFRASGSVVRADKVWCNKAGKKIAVGGQFWGNLDPGSGPSALLFSKGYGDGWAALFAAP